MQAVNDSKVKSGSEAELALDKLISQAITSIQILQVKYEVANQAYSAKLQDLKAQYSEASQGEELKSAIAKYVKDSGFGKLEEQYKAATAYGLTQLSAAQTRYDDDNERFDLKALLSPLADPKSPLSQMQSQSPPKDGQRFIGTLGRQMVVKAKKLVDTDSVYASEKAFVASLAKEYQH